MKKYKIIRLSYTVGNLQEVLNEYAEQGWEVKATLSREYEYLIILEREESSPSYRTGF